MNMLICSWPDFTLPFQIFLLYVRDLNQILVCVKIQLRILFSFLQYYCVRTTTMNIIMCMIFSMLMPLFQIPGTGITESKHMPFFAYWLSKCALPFLMPGKLCGQDSTTQFPHTG